MKLVATTAGKLYLSHQPTLGELSEIAPFDIIWNLMKNSPRITVANENVASRLVLLGEIEDYSIPSDIELFDKQLKLAVDCLLNGGKVLIHCGAGVGRTGLAAACVKSRLEGSSAGKALTFTKSACGGPETNEQRNFVRDYLKR